MEGKASDAEGTAEKLTCLSSMDLTNHITKRMVLRYYVNNVVSLIDQCDLAKEKLMSYAQKK